MPTAQIDVPLPMLSFRTVSAAVTLTLGLTALAASPALADGQPSPSPTPTAAPTPTPTPTPTPVIEPSATRLGHSVGHTATSRVIHLFGSDFGQLSAVLVDGVEADQLTVLDDGTATFLLGTAPDYQPGVVAISLVSDDGTVVPTSVTFTYTVTNRVDKEMAYAFAHWNDTASTRFGYIAENDCADFTSQTLLARGWKQSSQWYDKGPAPKTKLPLASATWVSSTAMSDWLHSRTDLATHLGYRLSDRTQAVVGDIIQFNWNWKKYPGVWQHTGVVSEVDVLPNGDHAIYYVAHTNNNDHGNVTWLARNMGKNLRIQFWHLKK